MATETQNMAPQVRAQYFQAWNETMIKIWRERINMLGVIEDPRRKSREGQPHLYERLTFLPVTHDGRYMEVSLTQEFLEYGLYQDFGVGREKYRGNPGDIGKTTKAGNARHFRERRKWFSTSYYRSVMNMKEFMAENMGHEFIGLISDAFERTAKA